MKGRQRATLIGATLILISALGCSRSASFYLDRGKQLAAQGKLDEAVITLQRALQKDPRLGAAYRELGSIYIKQQKGLEAFRAFEQAVQLAPGDNDAKRDLADLALAGYLADSSRPRLLYDRIDLLSRQMLEQNPNSFDGHRLRGYLAIFDRKPEQALEHLRKANEIKPDQPGVIQAMTQLLFQSNQPDEAERMALQLVERQKDFGPIYDILYRYYQSSQRADEAERLLVSKAANNPKNIYFAMELAAHYARMKKTELMNATIQRLLDNPADFPNARLLVGDFYVALGQPDRGRQYYEEGAQKQPATKIDYQKRLVTLLIAQHKNDEALLIVEEILKKKPDDAPTRAVRASLRLEKPPGADREAAVQEFKELVAKDPKNATLRYALGRALVTTGKTEEAGKEFREAIDRQPTATGPRYARADLALRRGDYAEALTESAAILKLRPNDPRARLIRASALTGSGSLADATQELRNLLTEIPNLTEADLQLGRVYVLQQKLPEAEALFRKHRGPDAAGFVAAQGLAQCLLLRNEPQKAIDILKEEIGRAPDPNAARLALADTALRVKQYPLAIEQYQALIAKDPKSSSLKHRLATAYELTGDHESAITTLQTAIQSDKDYPDTLLLLAQLLDAAGRGQEAVPLYQRLIVLRPNDAVALNNLAFSLSETGGNLDDALGLAERAKKILGEQPTVADTLGWIYVKKKMPAPAVQIFRNLVTKHPESATYHYHLGAALLLQGSKAVAKTELETALQKSASKPEQQKIRELLAGV